MHRCMPHWVVMGAVVEGWPYERIEKEYGTQDQLRSYQHYRNGWNREPGTTETESSARS